MVELKEFIRQTLFDIAEGVREANAAYRESRKTDHNAFVLEYSGGEKPGTGGIHFDVAVSTKATKGGKASIGVLSVGVGGERQQTSESVSRISFTVTVAQYLG